jgi:hypothetical protein
VTAWVAGSHAGQAAAAAVAAVVIGGTAAVVVSQDGGPGPAGTPAIAATTVAGLPGPGEAGPAGSGAPSAGPLSPGATPSGGQSSTPGSSPSSSPTAVPTASGTPTPGGPPSPTGSAAAVGAGTLVAGSPHAQGTLQAGATGTIAVPIRNAGDDPSHGLVVTLRLPTGITARGGSGSDNWTCTPGAVTTCTLDDLDGGDQTTVHVRVDVTAAAVPGGTASGTLRADGVASAPIPAGTLMVLP